MKILNPVFRSIAPETPLSKSFYCYEFRVIYTRSITTFSHTRTLPARFSYKSHIFNDLRGNQTRNITSFPWRT